MAKLELIQGSCIDQKTDVIVNAANRYLEAGGGVCGAIFYRAGYSELTNACKQHKLPLKNGEAVMTPAFNIKNAEVIIHAVGPNFSLTPNAFDKLREAYYKSLLVMMENGYHSISFPLISSGIFGGNLEDPAFVSASKCAEAYLQFIDIYSNYDFKAILCAFTMEEYESADKAFKSVWIQSSKL